MKRIIFGALATKCACSGSEPVNYFNEETWAEFPLCVNGKEQSPIDLFDQGATGEKNKLMQIEGYGYENMLTANIYRDPNTIKLNLKGGEFQINFDNGSVGIYEAVQLHFHAPSEHTFLGQSFDLEMHIVHKLKDKPDIGAVIAIFFDKKFGGDKPNQFISSLQFDKALLDKEIELDKINLAHLLKTVNFEKYWNYKGSLTTPPCTEGVAWTIIKTALPITDAQLGDFQQYYGKNTNFAGGKGNNRSTQPLLARTLFYNRASILNLSAIGLTFLLITLF